jgi:hypothetical protein
MDGCSAGDGLVYDGQKWGCGTVASKSVPTGLIAFFAASACPEGWELYNGLAGRVVVGSVTGANVGVSVGAALANQSTRTISDVPSHSHSVDAPSAATSSAGGSHSHNMGHTHQINPPNTGTSGGGGHTHNLNDQSGIGDGLAGKNVGGGGHPGMPYSSGNGPALVTTNNGSHSHNVNIPAFASSGSSNGNSGASATTHTHAVNIPAFNSSTTGLGAVDVTMPYLQLLPCRAL